MDKTCADTVRLLLAVAPDVFVGDIFAMKGGTAINLFVRDMPRLSVDDRRERRQPGEDRGQRRVPRQRAARQAAAALRQDQKSAE